MEIDDRIERVEQRVEYMDQRLKAIEQRLLTNEQTKGTFLEKRLSLNEFVLANKPKDDIERVLLVFYYREAMENHSSSGTKEIRETLVEAKQPLPANLSMCISRLVRRGWIQKIKNANGKTDSFELTGTATRQIQNMVSDGSV